MQINNTAVLTHHCQNLTMTPNKYCSYKHGCHGIQFPMHMLIFMFKLTWLLIIHTWTLSHTIKTVYIHSVWSITQYRLLSWHSKSHHCYCFTGFDLCVISWWPILVIYTSVCLLTAWPLPVITFMTLPHVLNFSANFKIKHFSLHLQQSLPPDRILCYQHGYSWYAGMTTGSSGPRPSHWKAAAAADSHDPHQASTANHHTGAFSNSCLSGNLSGCFFTYCLSKQILCWSHPV